MVDEKLKSIASQYDLDIHTEDRNGMDMFITLTSRKMTTLSLNVQYVNGQVYAVYFLNNQYFDEDEDTLYKVLQSILAGEYKIRSRGIFKKRRYVEVDIGNRNIVPERVTEEGDDEESYDALPKSFTLR